MFALYLEELGPNRLKVIQLVKDRCHIPFEEAKTLVTSYRPRLLTGEMAGLLEVQQDFAKLGASTVVQFYPEGIDATAWIPEQLSIDKKTCSKCGAPLFFAIPGLTTREEITAFASMSSIPNASEIARTGWIHPGVYCPRGCGFVMANVEGSIQECFPARTSTE